MLVGGVVQPRQHRPRAAAFADLAEAVALVEAERGIVRLDAERDLLEPVLLCLREQAHEKLLSIALATARRDDRDRELRRPLVDEPVARLPLLEQAVPGRADVARVRVRDHRGVTRSAPAHHVALHRALGWIHRRVLAPVVRVVEHVAEEARIVPATWANHGTSLDARSGSN